MAKNFEDIITRFVRVHQSERQTDRQIPWHVIHSHLRQCRVLPPGKFNGMSSQSHISHCRVLPLGEFTVMIPEPHATLQGVIIPSAILKIVFGHILFVLFFNAVRALRSGGFRIVSDTLVNNCRSLLDCVYVTDSIMYLQTTVDNSTSKLSEDLATNLQVS